MNKQKLRKLQIEKLKAFADKDEKKQEDQLLLANLMKTDLWNNSQSVGITSSLPIEVDTSELIARLWDEGKEVYLARANDDLEHSQDFLQYTYQSHLGKSKFGVDEVIDKNAKINNNLDLVIVPGLAFNINTHARLGFGGGYYDRFLAKYPTKTVALVNSQMMFKEETWKTEATDIPIDVIITPEEIID